jgi:hypothetical protein
MWHIWEKCVSESAGGELQGLNWMVILLSYFREMLSEVAEFCNGTDFKPHCCANPCIYFVSGEYQCHGNDVR